MMDNLCRFDANGRRPGADAVANGRLQQQGGDALNPDRAWVRQIEPGNLAQQVREQLEIVLAHFGILELVAFDELHPEMRHLPFWSRLSIPVLRVAHEDAEVAAGA